MSTNMDDQITPKRGMIIKRQSLGGLVSSQKMNRNVWFESSLERDFALMLEFHPEVTGYIEQPITIEYIDHDFSVRTYTPDFLVYFDSEKMNPWLCEIKYRQDLHSKFSRFKDRYRAAIEYAKRNGWEFKILTDQHFRTDLLSNLKFLQQYQREFVEEHCLSLIMIRVEDLGQTTIEELFVSLSDANPLILGKCIYATWFAIKCGKIGCDLARPLSKNTEIWKS